MTDIVENPLPRSSDSNAEKDQTSVAADSQGDTDLNSTTAARSELEATLKGLKDGSLSEQQAAAEMERLIDGRVDLLRAELTTQPTARTLLGPLIQTIFAHMTEAPTNVRPSTVVDVQTLSRRGGLNVCPQLLPWGC